MGEGDASAVSYSMSPVMSMTIPNRNLFETAEDD